MSRERANYIVNKTLALATFDKRGGITFHLRGNRETIINQICEVMALWDSPMDRAETAGIVDRAINRRRWVKWIWIAAIVRRYMDRHRNRAGCQLEKARRGRCP